LFLAVLGFVASAVFLFILYVLYKDELIGIIGIPFTIVVGFLVYFLQRKTDKDVNKAIDRIDKTVSKIDAVMDKMNQITERQYQIINEEKERKTRMKSSPIYHIIVVLNEARNMYSRVRERVAIYANNRTDQNQRILLNMCERHATSVNSRIIPFIKENVELAKPYLNNPWLAGKFLDSYILGHLGSIFIWVKENQNASDNPEHILEEIDT
jgi:hypothetical protein